MSSNHPTLRWVTPHTLVWAVGRPVSCTERTSTGIVEAFSKGLCAPRSRYRQESETGSVTSGRYLTRMSGFLLVRAGRPYTPDVPIADRLRLDGRVAIVTGAAQGIGAATAAALVELGCAVALCDREAEVLETTAADLRHRAGRVHPAVLDVRDEAAVDEFVAATVEELGRLDIVVNNA